MDWRAFRAARDLARQCGASPEKFEQIARKHNLLPESLAFCRQCWEAKDLASMSRQTKHTCCSCESDRSAAWNHRAQQRTLDAGATRRGALWNGRDDQYLEEHIKTDTLEQIAIALHRTRAAVSRRCSLLGLFEDRHKRVEIPPITDYTLGRGRPAGSSVIVQHQVENGRIAVWCCAATTEEEICEAFSAAGISAEQYTLWRCKRRLV